MLISVQFTFRMGEKYEKQRDYLSLCCGFIAVRISSEEKFWPPLVLPEQSPTRSESATHSMVLFHTSYRRLVAYSTESPYLADRTETHQSVWIKVTWNGSDFFCRPTQSWGRKRERGRPGADNVEKSTYGGLRLEPIERTSRSCHPACFIGVNGSWFAFATKYIFKPLSGFLSVFAPDHCRRSQWFRFLSLGRLFWSAKRKPPRRLGPSPLRAPVVVCVGRSGRKR